MIDVVANAKGVLNVLGHTRTSPEIGGESGRQGTLEQMFFQPPPLPWGEFEWSATGGNCLQCRPATQTQIVFPSPHTTRVHIQYASDFGLGNALREQLSRPFALALQFLRTALRSDRSPPHSNPHCRTLFMQESIAPGGKVRFALVAHYEMADGF